ncbi:exo-alpha-sialidase [Crossiella sp. CA198]|uniref:exo-alpha-sialidase n=1 Tax=Crossiella sp. CA198 TaxID=3455607 RepID=UPI003F8D4D2C
MRSRLRRSVAALLGGALLAGTLAAAPAAVAQPPLDNAGLANAMLGGYVRIADLDRDYARHLVASAELVDWRSKNPAADQTAATTHFNAIQRAIETAVPEVIWAQDTEDIVGACLVALQGVPGAVLDGAKITALRGALTVRDVTAITGRIEDRIMGALPKQSFNAGFAAAEAGAWAGVAATARADAAFKGAWDLGLGNTLGVSAAASGQQIGALPKFTQVLDIKPILEWYGNKPKFEDATKGAVKHLGEGLTNQRGDMVVDLRNRTTTHKPGKKPVEPDQAAKDAAEELEKKRQSYISGAKGGLDAVAFLVGINDPEGAKQVRQFAAGAVQLATAVNKCITAFTLINSVFSLATVAFTGNVIGAISTLVSLFASSGPTVEQVILEEIGKLQKQVEQLSQQLSSHFALLDGRLNDIYAGLTVQLGQMDATLEVVRGRVTDIERELTKLDNTTRVIGRTVVQSLGDLFTEPTWRAANTFVDFRKNYPGRTPTFEDYKGPENEFQRLGSEVMAKTAFAVPDDNRDPNDVADNLDLYGPEGSIGYLAFYAARLSGQPFPAAPKVGNPLPWKIAANAYTLATEQNPALAKQFAPERANAVIQAGLKIRDGALRFSEPGPNGTVNPLFGGLMSHYTNKIAEFYGSNAELEKEITRDRYGLFDGPTQKVQDKGGLEGDGQTKRCDADGGDRIDRPNNANGTQLKPAMMLARNIHDAPPSYDACWIARFDNEETVVTRMDCPGTTPCYDRSKFGNLRVEFYQHTQWPGAEQRQARRIGAWVEYRVRFESCWLIGEFEAGCSLKTTAPQQTVKEWPRYRVEFEAKGIALHPADTEVDAEARMRKFLTARQQDHYRWTARQIRETSRPNEVNLAVRLLRAYTELGFPRALKSDDHLRALLYGSHALHNSAAAEHHVLSWIYDHAANNLGNGVSPWLSDQFEEPGPLGCQRLPGLTTKDPLAVCMAWAAKVRLDRLAARYTEQFAQRYEGSDQTLPEVQQQLRKLWLAMKAVYPAFAFAGPIDSLPVAAPAIQRWSSPVPVAGGVATDSEPALTELNGRQIAVWRETNHKLYTAVSADGRTWSAKSELGGGFPLGTAPSVTVFNGKAVATWKAMSPQRVLFHYYSTSTDGSTWTTVQGPRTDPGGLEAPALAVANGRLYALARNTGGEMVLASSTDAVNWTGYARILGANRTSFRPALAAVSGKLAVAWKHPDAAGAVLSTSTDGTTWTAPSALAGGAGNYANPALTAVAGKLYALWPGVSGDQQIWAASSADGIAWSTAVPVIRQARTARPPAVTTFNGRLNVVWSDQANRLHSAVSAPLS